MDVSYNTTHSEYIVSEAENRFRDLNLRPWSLQLYVWLVQSCTDRIDSDIIDLSDASAGHD